MEEKSRGLHQHRISYNTSDDTITETVHVEDWLKYLFGLLVPVVVAAVVSLIMFDQTLFNIINPTDVNSYGRNVAQVILVLLGFWSYSVLVFVSSGPSLSLEAGEWGAVRGRSANPYYWLIALLGYTLAGIALVSVAVSSVWVKLCVPVLGSMLAGVHRWKPGLFSSPFDSPPVAMSMVPLLGATWMFLPVASVWIFSSAIGAISGSYTETALDPFLTRGLLIFIAAVVTFSLTTVMWLCKASDRVAQSLKDSNPEWFGSQIVRYAVISIYISLNLVGVLAGVVCLDLIYFGVTEYSLVLGSFQGWLGTMYSSYPVLERVFAGWPALSARTYAILIYELLLSPAMFFIGMWVYSTADHLVNRSRIFLQLNTAEQLESGVVPDSIDVVVSDSDLPNAHSGSLFFGWRDFIIVSQPLIDSLSNDELDAVLAHEVYHLKNQDWVTNLLASAFAVVTGGRNSLLVFYGYPRIEREADDYAVQVVGQKLVSDALEELEIEMLKLRKGGDTSTGDELPGIFGMLQDTRYWDTEQLSRSKRYLKAPYRLFFGPLLMDASHLSPEKRRERITD